MAKDKISRGEMFAVAGLLKIGQEAADELNTCIDRISDILDDDPIGHSADAVYEGYSVDTLLDKLGVEVSDEV